MLLDIRLVGVPLEERLSLQLAWWILLLVVIRVGVYEFLLRCADVRYFPVG
jgi:hypothetical protein